MGIESMGKDVDFLNQDLDFKIPVFFIQGEHDILTSKEISRTLYDRFKAPEKDYFLLPDAAHGLNQSVVRKQFEILRERVVN